MDAVTAIPPLLRTEDEERRGGVQAPLLTSAELAECVCPDACERDHDLD